MVAGEHFEISATKYLEKHYSKFASFMHQGGANSTISDIYVKTTKGKVFYIEAKANSAQAGQFVLIPDISNKTFIWSNQNKSTENIYTAQIKNHMNTYFHEFKDCGTKGKRISLNKESDLFSSWIVDYYNKKNVKFIISKNSEYVIFPLDEFKNNFDTTAHYRIKRSGSSKPPKNSILDLKSYVKKTFNIVSFIEIENSLFVESAENLRDSKFIFNNHEYMFSNKGNHIKNSNEYEIRKLSNTFNANVIFSVKLKSEAKGLTAEEFKWSLINI